MNLTLIALCGSLRKDSFNRHLLHNLARALPDGVALEIQDLHRVPPFDQDEEESPIEVVSEMKRRIRAADGVVFATPEYNYSMSGVLKNAIDWCSRPAGDSAWAGKPAAICGASIGTFGTVRAQLHLRQVALALDLRVMAQPELLVANAGERFKEDGTLEHPPTEAVLRRFAASFVEWIRRGRDGE